MIYPKKLSSKKGNKIITILMIVSIILAIILVLINKLTTPNITWAAFANCGIIYIWITAIYSIKKGTNIAGHVLIQTIIISLVILYIDNRLGFKGWSINRAIPIVLIIANISMLVLTIVSYKKYINVFIKVVFLWAQSGEAKAMPGSPRHHSHPGQISHFSLHFLHYTLQTVWHWLFFTIFAKYCARLVS